MTAPHRFGTGGRWPTVLAVSMPPAALAILGVTHPQHLTADSAGWWTRLHVVLVAVFPLLGVAHWILLRHSPAAIAWLGRIAAFSYIVFYGALDALAGIGTGTLMRRSGAAHAADLPEAGWLFAVGNDLGAVGAWSLFVASVFTAFALVGRLGRGAIPAVTLLVAATFVFAYVGVHIYWPRGVLTMLAMAVALGWLAMVDREPSGSDPT